MLVVGGTSFRGNCGFYLKEIRDPAVIGCHYVYVPNAMFLESFWCAGPLGLVTGIKWSRYPDVSLYYVDVGAGSWLNFHVILKALFIGIRVLFRVLCLGVSAALLGLCVTLSETVLQLIVLVVNIVVGPGCGRLVQSIVLVIGLSYA